MFCTNQRNGCGHYEGDSCAEDGCEWSGLDAISEERFIDGVYVNNGGRRHDGLRDVTGQAVVTDVNLRYLATMTSDEALLMADWARMLLLDDGSWGNTRADRWCEWCVGRWTECRHCAPADAAVNEFLERHVVGDHSLTEGMIHYWGNDISGELRLFRGWCPHLPFDKRLATEEREWRPT